METSERDKRKHAYRFFFGDAATRLGHEIALRLGRRRILTLAAVAAEGASADGCERSLYVLQAAGAPGGGGSGGGGSGDGGSGDATARLRDIRRLFLGNEYSGSSTGGAQGRGGGFTGGARRIIGLSEAKALQLDRALHSAGTTSGRSTATRRRGVVVVSTSILACTYWSLREDRGTALLHNTCRIHAGYIRIRIV